MLTYVQPDKCDGCGQCLDACALGAIRLEDGRAEIDPARCRNCSACVDACPRQAIEET